MTRQNTIPGLMQTVTMTEQKDDAINVVASIDSDTSSRDTNNAIPTLIPLWDMANHADGELTTFYNVTKQQVEGAALQDYQKGDQIFIFYGVRHNINFLTHNGFVYPENRHDSVIIILGLSSTDPLHQQRSSLMQMLAIPIDYQLLVLPAPHFISSDLLAFVRVFNMNAEQLDYWLAAVPDTVQNLKHLDCALDTALDTKAWTFLKIRLSLLLRSFGTTLAEDEAIIKAQRAGHNKLGFVRGMLTQYRVLEKRMLTDALDYVIQRIKQ